MATVQCEICKRYLETDCWLPQVCAKCNELRNGAHGWPQTNSASLRGMPAIGEPFASMTMNKLAYLPPTTTRYGLSEMTLHTANDCLDVTVRDHNDKMQCVRIGPEMCRVLRAYLDEALLGE